MKTKFYLTLHASYLCVLYDRLQNGTQPSIDGKEGRRSVEIILGIYQAAESGGAVEFPLAFDPELKARETGVGGA